MDDSDLLGQAEAWLAQDIDPATRADLAELIRSARAGDAHARAELADAFRAPLSFGTAGLRGRLGPGSNRMNRVVVARAASGLAEYLRDTGGHSIVIGYDARRYSDVFARDTAEIMAGAGISTMVMPRPLPTPVTAFAIHALGASAAVMVTASHNPAADNGYKVYLADGRQIVPPADIEIAQRIAAVGAVADIPRSDDYITLDDAVLDAYVARAAAILPTGARTIRTVYTAMHGVGGDVFLRAAAAAGFPEPVVVAAQFEADPDFPTVPFPNPEEAGAMDLALEEARRCQADIVIANDPDADRCAIGVAVDGDWRMLTGDEVGSLLGWWIAERVRGVGDSIPGTMAESIVSGSLLARIAEDAGLGYAVTLTGFKWISRVPGLVYGYEEALGYCVDPTHVSDKDGITAALLMMEMAASLAAQGSGIPQALDDLARRFGLYLTSQVSIRVDDVGLIADAMARLRAEPPGALGGLTIASVDDLQAGVDGLPPTDGLRFASPAARVIVRPSGTEPKLKCYLQVVEHVADGDVAAARAKAEAVMEGLRTDIRSALGL